MITYNALISAYGEGIQAEQVLKIFEDMKRRGLEPDVIAYSALISACETHCTEIEIVVQPHAGLVRCSQTKRRPL